MRLHRLWTLAALVGVLAFAFLVPPIALNPPLLLVVPLAVGAIAATRRYGTLRAAVRVSLMRWHVQQSVKIGRALQRAGIRQPFPGWPLVAGGSTAPVPTPPPGPPPGTLTLTKEALVELIKATAAEAMAPAVKAAFEPLAQAQGSIMEKLLTHFNFGAKPDSFDEKTLGKYPIGRKIRALCMATIEGHGQDPDAAVAAIKSAPGWTLAGGREETLKWLATVKTTLSSGVAATAGDMILPEYDPTWIELLRNNTVIRSMARTVPMPRGATSRRKQTGASTAYYQGELERMTPSNLTVARVPLSYKKLTALSVISNDLIRFSGGEADRIVQEDFLRVVALREDRAFINGNPPVDAGSPQGIRYQTAALNIYASAGATLANFQADLTEAIKRVQRNNVPATPENSAFLISPSTFWTLYALATTTGDMIFAAMLGGAQPQLFGFPAKITSQLETGNSWIGANAGMVMFVHGPALEIHDALSRTVESFRGGAYYDPALAAVVSGISQDETVVTCISEHDFLQVYEHAAAIVTGYAT